MYPPPSVKNVSHSLFIPELNKLYLLLTNGVIHIYNLQTDTGLQEWQFNGKQIKDQLKKQIKEKIMCITRCKTRPWYCDVDILPSTKVMPDNYIYSPKAKSYSPDLQARDIFLILGMSQGTFIYI